MPRTERADATAKRLVEQGERVRARREQVGVSLRGLATSLGIDASSLSRVEQGKRDIPDAWENALASALGVSSMYIRYGTMTDADWRAMTPPDVSIWPIQQGAGGDADKSLVSHPRWASFTPADLAAECSTMGTTRQALLTHLLDVASALPDDDIDTLIQMGMILKTKAGV